MEFELPTTAGKVQTAFGGELIGDGDSIVRGLTEIKGAGPGALSYLANGRFAPLLKEAAGAVVFSRPNLVDSTLPITFISVSDPKKSFYEVARRLQTRTPYVGVSELASIDPTAELGQSVSVGPYTVISAGVKIGDYSHVGSSVYLGRDVTMGSDCLIHPGVKLLEGVELGNRVKVFANSVLGSDGFGFVPDPAGGYVEIPQIGKVIVEDDVRIGALCTIDRAALGETRIGLGTKIDDHVHVAHNCKVGKFCVLCGGTALAGSVVLEDDVILGGQVGLGDHVVIGKGARLGGQSGTPNNLKGGETYWATPSVPVKESLRNIRNIKRLPKLIERIRKLEEKHGDQ